MKLPPDWKLPDTIKNRLGQKRSGKQRAMIADDHLLLVLHRPPEPGENQRVAMFFWRHPEGNWQHSGGGVGLQPLIKHIRDYSDAADRLGHTYEQAQVAEDYFRLLEDIAPLRLATKHLHDTLQSAREGVPGDRDLIDLRDWAYETERSLDLLYENTKNALDFKMAQRTEDQTRLAMESVRAGHRLNVLAAIFFPLTAVSCVFGMNLNSGLENTSITTFWITSGLAVGLGLFVRRWVERGKWL